MQEGLQGARLLGVDRVEAVHRLVQPEAEFHLPAHPVEVSHRVRADPGREIREEETIAFRGLNPDEAQMQRSFPFTDMYIGIHGPTIKAKDIWYWERASKISPREEGAPG